MRARPGWAALVLATLGAGSAAAQQPAPPAVRYEQHVPVGGSPPPAGSIRNPLGPEAADAGAKLFGAMNCDGCHGGGAVGNIGPSLSDGRWRYGGSDGAIYHSIFYGRPRGMPAFGGHLPAESIWQIVSYLRSLEPVRDTLSTTAWPP